MIQRIQSIYWLLIVVAIVVLFAIPISTLDNGTSFHIHLSLFQGQNQATTSATLDYPGLIISIGILLLTLYTILRFKNRKQQMQLGKLNYLLILLLIGNTIYRIANYEAALELSKLSLPVTIGGILLILNLLAIRGVKKDDDLVRSADRIR